MSSQPFVSSLFGLTIAVASASAGAQTSTPPATSSAAPPSRTTPPATSSVPPPSRTTPPTPRAPGPAQTTPSEIPGPPGSVPIEPERREPEPPGQAPSPAAPPESRAGKVEFVPNDPSVSLLMQSGVAPMTYGVYEYDWWGYGWPRFYRGYTPVFTSICRGRCTVAMEPGTYDLALEKNGRVVPAEPTNISGSAKLTGNYVDRSGTRTTGVVIGVAGTVGGIVMMIASSHSHYDCDVNGVCFQHTTLNDGLFAAGLGTVIGSIIVGSILGSVHDRAEITVTPLRLSSTPGFMGVALDRAVTDGAALSLRF